MTTYKIIIRIRCKNDMMQTAIFESKAENYGAALKKADLYASIFFSEELENAITVSAVEVYEIED